jgi:cellulose synthase/poly-beta-1,6-N-acetylglucosamine synthase-like glycosyltransferase
MWQVLNNSRSLLSLLYKKLPQPIYFCGLSLIFILIANLYSVFGSLLFVRLKRVLFAYEGVALASTLLKVVG